MPKVRKVRVEFAREEDDGKHVVWPVGKVYPADAPNSDDYLRGHLEGRPDEPFSDDGPLLEEVDEDASPARGKASTKAEGN